MNKRIFSLTAMALILTVASLSSIPWVSSRKGPRTDDMSITFYSTIEAAYTALTTGEIDLIAGAGYSPSLFPTGNLDAGGFLTAAQADNAFTNPNIVTAEVRAFNMYQFDLNNNYTIADYPWWRSPMNYTEMRQAVAFLSDKDYYVNALGERAERIDQPLPARLSDWGDPALMWPFYPYEYSPANARAVLDNKFPEGTTPNPYYDALEPLSSQYLRTYPAGHEKEGQDLDPMKFKVRNDHIARREAARVVVDWMWKLGVPIESHEAPSTVLCPIVMQDFNYHFYTGAWTTWKYPTHVYPLYHSAFAYSEGPNYVTGYGTHPQLDRRLEQFYYSLTFGDAVAACQIAMREFTLECVTVPLWSDRSYCAWNKNMLGVVNMDGYGIVNPYTFMNAYKVDGSPIRGGTITFPLMMNSVYSSWATSDIVNLDRMNLYSCFDSPPYNLAIDQPGFVTDWETTTWDGGTKTLVRMNFRDDGYFAKPVSGDQGERVNASHYFFNAWLDRQVGDGWFWPSFKDLNHIDITDTYDVEIYFDTLSYWNTYAATGPLRPMDTWMAVGDDFINQTVESFVNPTTPGPISLVGEPIWIDYVTMDGTPLTMFTDYNIVLGDLYIYSTLGVGTLEVSYRYITSPTALRGTTAGGIAWQTIFEGAGPYYCTAYASNVFATFKRNPFHYMVTPLLGEIDFVKKPSGNYKVDIYDLAIAGGAFGSQGTGVPSSNWFAGADVAPEPGVIDIFDEVTVTGVNWNQEFDPTEP